MAWSETSPMDERAGFVLEAFSDCFTMTELCERYRISRKTGYRWINRYRGGEIQPRESVPGTVNVPAASPTEATGQWGPCTLREAACHEDRGLQLASEPDLRNRGASQRDARLRVGCGRSVVSVLWRRATGKFDEEIYQLPAGMAR
jgi:hypothetical protein